jgi:hypothetical protein
LPSSSDLFKPVETTLSNVGNISVWNVRFTPTRDVELTGLGLLFDPINLNVTPSLHLSLWQDEVVSNEDRLAILQPRLDIDFFDSGLNTYMFNLADFPEFNNPTSITLEQDRTYIFVAQVNIAGQWPLQVSETQELPFTTPDGSLVVLGGGPNTASTFPRHAPLVVELEPQVVPELPSILSWLSIVALAWMGATCRRRRILQSNQR